MTYGRIAVCAAITVLFSFSSFPVAGQDITRIEEDWRVVVTQPDADINAPQLTTIMLPDCNFTADYFSFELNHTTYPVFAAGGLQLQYWQADVLWSSTERLSESLLSGSDETLTWTQSIELDDGALTFCVENFQSNTWSDVHPSDLSVSVSYPANNLNQYGVADSLENSTIGFSDNRVSEMTLLRVRQYSGDELVGTVEVMTNLKE